MYVKTLALMVRLITHRAHDFVNAATQLLHPLVMAVVVVHFIFLLQIEVLVPKMIRIKNRPELFTMAKTERTYDFSFGHQFGAFTLDNLEVLSPETIKEMILEGEKEQLKDRLDPLIYDALKLAEFYRIDPFWFLSIMKVESHFKNSAISGMNAQGLMQIMPNTAIDIFQRMNRQIEPELAQKMMQDERINMEMGAYYLKYLLKKFNYNYKFATIAYNMGPYWVLRRLRSDEPVGKRNFYWTKVKRAYRKMSRSYRNHLKSPQRIPSLVLN